MPLPEPVVIWWLRRDLRLSDNQTLYAALQTGLPVLPLFIVDPRLIHSPYVGPKRLAFLWESLRQLQSDLEKRGSTLILRRGLPEEVLPALATEVNLQGVFAEPDYSPFARRRDGILDRTLPMHWVGSPAVRPPGTVLKQSGEPYTVFTPFSKAWKSLPGLEEITALPKPGFIRTPTGIHSEPIPDQPILPSTVPFAAGEGAAQAQLQAFVDQLTASAAIYRYAAERDRPDLPGTSRLSPYLRFGMLSPRQAVSAALRAIRLASSAEARRSAETWLNELIWREFYIHILFHYPQVRRQNFRPQQVHWLNQTEYFGAWCAGRTGYPLVDAAMRQLVQTGWMHNRLRMVTASFLTKDLLIDWRWGERFFMQHLIDGDPAANNGGWQWTAGTGTDAAPYFRIFSPISQSQRHDPDGHFIRHWLPELGRVPDEYIHTPWLMPLPVQQAAGCRIGQDYPAPLVDHRFARERALQAYR